MFLHGGPGGGTDPSDRGFFNPEKYKIILFDQRGAGKSTPSANLEDNTTWDLVKDIERLRELLQIEKWHVFGGSWVRNVSLSMGDDSTETCTRVRHFRWHMHRHTQIASSLSSCAASLPCARANCDSSTRTVPPTFSPKPGRSFQCLCVFNHIKHRPRDEYLAPIPEAERGDLITAYHAQLNSVDEETRLTAAKAWAKWEMATSKLYVDPKQIAHANDDKFANAFARIENHYFVNDVRFAFLPGLWVSV